MSTANVNWKALSDLSGAALKAEVFSILQIAALDVQNAALDEPSLLSAVPRLADLIESRPDLASFGEAFSALARSVGLLNYIDRTNADARDELAAELATIPELGIVLHREQLAALNALLGGQNLILSAPTSFGKSILIDVLLLHSRYRRVAIVLPTIALLDEFRRRLVQRFGNKYDIIMHHSEKPTRENTIFLGTQERLINRADLGTLDLVVVDEFYKLDPERKDERSITLNAAVYRLLSRAKQFFFLGPNIENVSISADSRWGFSFLRTRFSTVAVDTIDLRTISNKEQRLRTEARNERNWPVLVFVSSPDWMAENYGGRWDLSDAVTAGIAVHHGRIPRALASRFITLFNRKELPILICTSTLIEGVNTAAKSVMIYDKKIARKDFDFFTFSNIKGRAGRLGQHHVGQVFLFHTPPGEEDIEVSAPLFGDLEDAPDEFVVHVDEIDSTPAITERITEMAQRVGLDPSEIRRFSSLGVDVLVGLRAATEQAIRIRANLAWSGRPSYEQIEAVCRVICKVRTAQEFGCGSDRQLAMYIHRLRTSSTMREFYKWHTAGYRGDPQRLDNVFKFLRAAEYSLPEYFAVVQLFVTKAGKSGDYSFLLAELPRWFRAEALKILEEQGVPIQISERFLRKNDTVAELGRRLRALALAEDNGLSPVERQWILDALPASLAGGSTSNQK
jgi:hypothetical protein